MKSIKDDAYIILRFRDDHSMYLTSSIDFSVIYRNGMKKHGTHILWGHSVYTQNTMRGASALFYKQLSKPGNANWDANVSTWFRSSTISLFCWRPLRKSLCCFPCSLCTAKVIWAALKRNSAIISKSDSTHPLDVIAGVPEWEKAKYVIDTHQHNEMYKELGFSVEPCRHFFFIGWKCM